MGNSSWFMPRMARVGGDAHVGGIVDVVVVGR